MNEYNERILKNVLQDIRQENDDELLKESEDAKNDPLFQIKDGEAEAFVQKYFEKSKKKNHSHIKSMNNKIKVEAYFFVFCKT